MLARSKSFACARSVSYTMQMRYFSVMEYQNSYNCKKKHRRAHRRENLRWRSILHFLVISSSLGTPDPRAFTALCCQVDPSRRPDPTTEPIRPKTKQLLMNLGMVKVCKWGTFLSICARGPSKIFWLRSTIVWWRKYFGVESCMSLMPLVLAQDQGPDKTRLSVLIDGKHTRTSSVQRLQPTSRFALPVAFGDEVAPALSQR